MAEIRRRRSATLTAVTAAALALSGACSWGEEAAVRARLSNLVADVNKPAAEGLALVAHAASIGEYFTVDTNVELGLGAAPIQGREMLVGMVARLQPRTAAYRITLEDVDVRLGEDDTTAGVAVTVSIVPRDTSVADGPDARELALTMTRADGTWRIARLTAVQALR